MAIPTFGTDGVRGVANTELTPEVALALGRAASGVLEGSTFLVGRDPRRSGTMIEAALIAGLTSGGADVERLGMVPTPAVAWACARRNLPGAMISASHNPFADNGIKIFAAGGLKLADSVEAEVQARFHELLISDVSTARPSGMEVGEIRDAPVTPAWISELLTTVEPDRFAGLHIVLDCANGSASTAGPEVFRRLGAHVTALSTSPDGSNINTDCGSTSPEALQAAVIDAGADLGLAFDGDADRLVAVDGTGALVDGDHILAILATDWKTTGRLPHDTLVVTVMSNLGLHRAMAAAGVEVRQTAVGDRYVLAELDAGGFGLGGEQSGHIICRALASTGDGILAGVQLVDAVVRSGTSLADLSSQAMTTVPQVLKNVRLAERRSGLIDAMHDAIVRAEAAMGDDGRVLVRASGTEPLIRVMVEHLDPDTADRVADELVAVVEDLAPSA